MTDSVIWYIKMLWPKGYVTNILTDLPKYKYIYRIITFL